MGMGEGEGTGIATTVVEKSARFEPYACPISVISHGTPGLEMLHSLTRTGTHRGENRTAERRMGQKKVQAPTRTDRTAQRKMAKKGTQTHETKPHGPTEDGPK